MNEKLVLTGSIVLFKESLSDLHKTIDSFLHLPFNKKLYLIDNTATRFYEYVFVNEEAPACDIIPKCVPIPILLA